MSLTKEEYQEYLNQLNEIKSRWENKEVLSENEVLDIIIAYLEHMKQVNNSREKDNVC